MSKGTRVHESAVERAEIAAEQRHVDRVYERLDTAAASASRIAVDGQGRGRTDRTGSIREEEATGLFERDVLVHAAARRIAQLEGEQDGLVFGRLDLALAPSPDDNDNSNDSRNSRNDNDHTDDGAADRTATDADGNLVVRYVGRIGVRDDEYEPLVIDWRAPAAEPFYHATPTRPSGVVRRRVLRSRGRRVLAVDDDLLDPDRAPEGLPVIGDGALMASLRRSRGDQMRDIVATIQADQDRAVRAPVRGATVITGGPGTGKTVVALHRAAYLLYSDRQRLSRAGVLVVGPTPAFLAYIERVLPGLGEDTVTLRSMGGFVPGVTATRTDPERVTAVKGAAELAAVLRRLAHARVPDAPTSVRVFVRGVPVELDNRRLDRLRTQLFRRSQRPRNAMRGEVRTALLDALADAAPDELLAQLDGRDDLIRTLRGTDAFDDFVAAWWPVVSGATVLGWLRDRPTLAYATRGLLSDEDRDVLATGIDPDRPTVADVALLDEVDTHLGSPPPPEPDDDDLDAPWLEGLGEVAEVTTSSERRAAARAAAEPVEERYGHVLVDEAQDLSPMQWRMVGRRGRGASWTVVGDPAQSSWPDPAAATAAMREALGRAERHEFHLDTNYRNSAEIYRFAGRVIRAAVPDADVPTAVRETGHEPEQLITDAAKLVGTAAEQAVELLPAVEGTVGLIATPDTHTELGERLDAIETDWRERIRLIAPLDSKGLEYDAVVVCDPGRITTTTPGGVRALYVTLTRATQRLLVVTDEPLVQMPTDDAVGAGADTEISWESVNPDR